MFGKLKEKLKSWAKKVSEKTKEKPVEKVVETKKETLEKIKKESGIETAKKVKRERKERTSEEIRGEREVTDRVIEDIKKERGTEDIRTLPRQEEIEEEIRRVKEEYEEPGKPGFFKRITSKINKVKITEKEFGVYSEELEMLLLENNVALEVAEKMIQELKEKIVGKELLKKEIEGEIKDCFKEVIEEILVEPFNVAEKIKEKIISQLKEPYVILFCGINGTGKTTTVAKIADSLKKQGITCVMAAADTFRAASIEQIKKHGEKIGIKVIANEYGSDPASVGFDAVNYAKKNLINCVLIDTAGRMHTSKNLIKEIEKIAKVCKPDLKIFVGESLTGNDAIEQVKGFDWAIGIDGIILTKADIDEKGGTALSVGYVTKKPILYLGTGQDYDEIEPFSKIKFIKTLGLD